MIGAHLSGSGMNSVSPGTGEAAGFPVLLRLFDALLARGDEIPPDVARAFQRGAAEEHQPRFRLRANRNSVAGSEDQQARAFKIVGGDLDLAVDDIDRALLGVGIERRLTAAWSVLRARST